MESLTALGILKAKALLGANTPYSSRYVVLLEDEYRLILRALDQNSKRKVPRHTVRTDADG